MRVLGLSHLPCSTATDFKQKFLSDSLPSWCQAVSLVPCTPKQSKQKKVSLDGLESKHTEDSTGRRQLW